MSTLPATLPAFDRRLVAAVAAGFCAVALAGYLVGHRSSSSGSREQTLTASTSGVLLNFPSSWQTSASAPVIQGLPIAHPLLLSPAGAAGQAGLIVGALPAGQPSPLPSQFIAAAARPPQTAVVNLQEAQAYRYTGLIVPGTAQALTVFVLANPGASPTALACFATAALAHALQACEHIVATVTLVGQPQSYELTPQPAYASQLGAAITALDLARTALRREMGTHASPATVQRAASRLSAAFAHAASQISALEPTIATGGAQGVLSSAILQARLAYAGLAGAAGHRDQGAFAAARTRVQQTETGVDEALEGFALLGYRSA